MSTEEPPPELPSQPRRRGFRTGRLEAFSDGVFAIAVTLLVLDIGVSRDAGRDLLHAIGSLWPSYLAYVASFSTIGAAWLAHNAITEYLDRADAAFVRLNLLLLLFVSFLPFPTKLMAEYLTERGGERVAVVFFGTVLFLQSLMLIILSRYAEREDLFKEGSAAEQQVESRQKYQLAPSLIAFAVAAALGILAPYLGAALYLVIALYLGVPIRVLTRAGRAS